MTDIPPILAAILLHPEAGPAIADYVEEHGVEALEADEEPEEPEPAEEPDE